MLKQINDPLPAPRLFRPDLPVELENILVKALAAKPEDRYSNMAEFADELERLEDNQILPALDRVASPAGR